jgi:hypothetical protein
MADQPDVAVQANESDEVRALRQLAAIAGWCVTATTNGAHAENSLHKVKATNGYGRAVDLASRTAAGWDTEALLRINEAVLQLLPLSMISELIYAGIGGICVKNGRLVDGYAVYGPLVMAAHHNHVHLGVIPGFTYNGSQEVAHPMPDNDPNLPDIVGPVAFAIAGSDSNGVCQGYYIFSHATGELHSFGPGAKFYGRSEVTKLVAT